MKKEISDKENDDKDNLSNIENENNELLKEVKESKNKNNKKCEKALFIQRAVAFIIDSVIVLLISSLISTPFIDTSSSDKINKELSDLNKSIINSDVSNEEYLYRYMDLTYSVSRNNGITTLINITICILYFVVFQIYNKGQTIGKKFMNIRVVSQSGDLSMNQMIFRSMICNSILVDILSVVFLIFASKEVFFYCVGLFSLMYYVIFIISVFMVMYGKEGTAIHDKIVHTKVIKVN